MRVERVRLRTIRLPLREPFRTASGVTRARTILLVGLDVDGVGGEAECVAGEAPTYSPETVTTARWVLETHLIPAILGKRFRRAKQLSQALDGAVRGHPMAKAALEMAAWDAEARARDEALATLLGGVRDAVPVGVSLGLQDDVERLLDQVDAAVDRGYRRIKLKVHPGRDLEMLEAVRSRHPFVPLSVDANGSYTPADTDRLADMDAFRLLYLEQPFAADRLVDHAALQARVDTPVCLDESVDSPGRCRDALELGACQVVNLKPGRVGGHGAALAIHDLCRDAGLPVWCGGMLESGIGRAHNVALASLPNMRLPGDVSPSERYWERDVVVPPFEMQGDGTVGVPVGPGIGVELDEEFLARIEVDRAEFR